MKGGIGEEHSDGRKNRAGKLNYIAANKYKIMTFVLAGLVIANVLGVTGWVVETTTGLGVNIPKLAFAAGNSCPPNGQCNANSKSGCVSNSCCSWEDNPSKGGSPFCYCDCSNDKLYCVNGNCVECVTHEDCPTERPICENNVCKKCQPKSCPNGACGMLDDGCGGLIKCGQWSRTCDPWGDCPSSGINSRICVETGCKCNANACLFNQKRACNPNTNCNGNPPSSCAVCILGQWEVSSPTECAKCVGGTWERCDGWCVNGNCVDCSPQPPTECAKCINNNWVEQCAGSNQACKDGSCVNCDQSPCPAGSECGQSTNACGQVFNCGSGCAPNKVCADEVHLCLNNDPCGIDDCGIIQGKDCGDCSGQYEVCDSNDCEECYYRLDTNASGFGGTPLPINGTSPMTGQFRCVWRPTNTSPNGCSIRIDRFPQNVNSGSPQPNQTANTVCNAPPFGNPNSP